MVTTVDPTIASLSYGQLEERKQQLDDRLQLVSVPPPPKQSSKISNKLSSSPTTTKDGTTSSNETGRVVPIVREKTDTHYDFLCKEMQWLAADFSSERKRHLSKRKKIANAVQQHFATKEARRVKELADAEFQRRRLAARISKSLKTNFWTKLERVITYKQKIEADLGKRKAMNQQLVQLVKQTEKYSDSMVRQMDNEDEDDWEEESGNETDKASASKRRRRRSRMTIEEALQVGSRRSRRKVADYARMNQLQDRNDSMTDNSLYGESTDDSGSDSSYKPLKSDYWDDETTLQEAEDEEIMERRKERPQDEEEGDDDDETSFHADPEELRKLEEESTMDVQQVLNRLQEEAAAVEKEPEEVENENGATTRRGNKRVKFAEKPLTLVKRELSPERSSRARRKPLVSSLRHDPGEDADDDADASDVEDFVDETEDMDIDGDEEDFVADETEVDDETTIAQEEMLPQQMTAEEEINLLKAENEMSVEELRARYAVALAPSNGDSGAAVKPSVDPGRTSLSSLLSPPDEDDAMEEDVDDGDDGSEEFVADANEVDDETTIAQEEKMPQEMSAAEEIKMLQAENEMSVEELRQRYAGAFEQGGDSGSGDEAMEEEESYGDDVDGGLSSLLAPQPAAGTDDEGDLEEYDPQGQDAVDDETTIEAEEKLGREMSYEAELALLKREGEMSVEELRKMYAGALEEDAEENRNVKTPSHLAELEGDFDDQENDEEFRLTVEEKDDETTIEAEERLGREMSVEEEIATLKRESEEPIEDLLERYKSIPGYKRKRSSQDESDDEDDGVSASADSGGEASDSGRAALVALEKSADRARRTRATRPYLLSPWVKLREYQQVGLNWLVSMQTRRLNGVLADEMGLGKTLQTISLLAYLAAYKGIWGPHLIVVPTSVILNWETEFKRFCPAMKVLCYYGPAKRRKELRTGWTKTNWYHVVITSYQLAVQDAFAFKRKKWYYLVLDEAQNIKNFQSQRWQTLINFNTQRRLLLTGTPLQNNLMELWSLLHFLMPYIFRSRKEFSYWFANPMNNIIEGSGGENEDVVTRLHGIIRPFVLRRLKKDVETQMPGKFEHIIKCQLSRRQMFIYEEFLARSSTRQALTKGGNFMGMMNVLMQLRKVCNHPDLFEPRSVVTPFVAEKISCTVPSCVVSATDDSMLSPSLTLPLWSGSSGLPSFDAALRHDVVESDELLQLETTEWDMKSNSINDDASAERFAQYPAALRELLAELDDKNQRDRDATMDFLRNMNSRRCRSMVFAYPRRLIEVSTIECDTWSDPSDSVLSSPAALLSMRRSLKDRAELVDGMIKKFVFCVPKANAPRPVLDTSLPLCTSTTNALEDEEMADRLEQVLSPFRNAAARLSSFFPDKQLVQFDAGKLQTLAELLRELKRGGHRVLIFTQMSKMLDILEAFLNLNGHTYLRLDGSTGVDRRQRLMDRFNGDPKIFCFILSTRSGGLGINLTGADTVVFYDQDWNPAMDAQAQDRAHRIGQTREVHIYRLVTEHTIEENILLKARQKRNLDILVMDRGKFDASQLFSQGEHAKAIADSGDSSALYTKGGLRDILGFKSKNEGPEIDDVEAESGTENMEKTMASLEDVDDVRALQGAQKEAADELKEFDENAEIKKNTGSDDEDEEKVSDRQMNSNAKEEKSTPEKEQNEEQELEKEIAAWQDQVGMDAAAIEASLKATERYGLRFKEEIDPFYSIFAVMEYRRKMEAEHEADNEIDIDELERQKAAEEKNAMDEGDLLSTRPRPEDLLRQRDLYQRERARLRANKKRRLLTGQNWESRVDGLSKLPFWYNIDTGEAVWDKPAALVQLEAYEKANEELYSAMPAKPLVNMMEFLLPFPDRINCTYVSKHWKAAATDPSFVIHVYPVEMGAYTRDDSKIDRNHYRTISDAVARALPGDTIELGDGHYWVNEDIVVECPLKLVGDENDPSNVVIEMGGTLIWKASSGWCEGVTFRRPKIASGEPTESSILQVHSGGKLDIIESIFDNSGHSGTVVNMLGTGEKGSWKNVSVKGGDGGIHMDEGASLDLLQCRVASTRRFGLNCRKSNARLQECVFDDIKGTGIVLTESSASLTKCRMSGVSQIIEKGQGSNASCSGNRVIGSGVPQSLPPGFKMVN